MVLLYIARVSVEGVTNQIIQMISLSSLYAFVYSSLFYLFVCFFIVFSTGIVRVTFQYASDLYFSIIIVL